MNKAENLLQKLKILLKDRGLLTLFAICVALGIGTVFASGKVLIDYTAAEEIQAKIETMEEYLQKFQAKKKKLDSEEKRPIDTKELENVQAEILSAVQNNNLQMEGLRSISADDKAVSTEPKSDAEEVVDGEKKKSRRSVSKNKAYELTVTGSYEDVMQFLTNFQRQRALITMRALTIAPQNDNYKIKLNYKIYVK